MNERHPPLQRGDYSVFSLTEHAMLCLTERIHAALDGFAIPVSRDPL